MKPAHAISTRDSLNSLRFSHGIRDCDVIFYITYNITYNGVRGFGLKKKKNLY